PGDAGREGMATSYGRPSGRATVAVGGGSSAADVEQVRIGQRVVLDAAIPEAETIEQPVPRRERQQVATVLAPAQRPQGRARRRMLERLVQAPQEVRIRAPEGAL